MSQDGKIAGSLGDGPARPDNQPPASLWDGRGSELQFTAFSSPSPLRATPHQAIALRAVYATPSGAVDVAVLLPTEPRSAVLGLIAYGSSITLTAVDLLTVRVLTSQLSMWTSTESHQWPNLCATRVAAALGHCREIVYGTAVFTGALDTAGNPSSLTAAQAAHVRDLTWHTP